MHEIFDPYHFFLCVVLFLSMEKEIVIHVGKEIFYEKKMWVLILIWMINGQNMYNKFQFTKIYKTKTKKLKKKKQKNM